METQRFAHKKSLGQHFLTSDVVPGWMCDAATIAVGDTVLEVGPGTGALTKVLLERGATVIALEADARALSILETTFAKEIKNHQLTLRHSDVRTLDLATIEEIADHSFKVVANIPYYLSGFLFRAFLESPVQPSDLVFLVQKEVARRAASNFALGQKHSLLSLSTQVYGEVQYVKTVTRGHFNPPPKVDSAIVSISTISRQRFIAADETTFFTILHYGFAQKRKQLLGNLAAHYDRETLVHIFSTLSLSLTVRAEDVPLENWLSLTTALTQAS